MNYLKSVNIKNYKCFENVSFNLKDINILIGENNAGKSTVIEALKLIAYGIEKAKNGRFSSKRDYINDAPIFNKCIILNIENLLIDISTSSYKYNTKPSIITAYFDNNIKTIVTIIEKTVMFEVFKNDTNIASKQNFLSLKIAPVFVMPHFNLLRELETVIDERRTKNDRFNYRSSLHFRNELLMYKDDLQALNDLISQTWQNITLDIDYKLGDLGILALVRDKDFAAEIKNYGSGLQMWVQILWFICKINITECIVILDEPDVYIHADLQRKLYQLVSNRFNQIIIATHSIEIINEANLENILCVNKNLKRFSFCKNKSSLWDMLTSLGTHQNFVFTKLHRYNKCLFVEGNDLEYIDYLFKICNSNQTLSIKDYAYCKLEGKNNYKEIFGAAKLFYDDSNGEFNTYCLLDKDYNEDFNSSIKDEATKNNVKLYILDRVEIENYLIVPQIFAQITNQDICFIEEKILSLADSLKGPTFDRILKEKVEEYRKLKLNVDISNISKETREFFNKSWNTFENIIKIVPGKELKGKIFEWIQKDFNIHMTDKLLFQYYKKEFLPNDLLDFLIDISK